MTETSTKKRAYRGESLSKRQTDRRRHLLNTSLELIGEQGYARATVRAVCNAASLTERYFYESFQNREELLAALYREQTDALQWQMIAASEQAGQTPEQLVHAALSAFFTTMRDKPHTARLILFEILGVSEAMNQLYYEAMEGFADLSRKLAQSVGTEKIETPADDGMVYAGLIGAVVQIGRRWVLNDYQQSIESVIASAFMLYQATAHYDQC